MTSARAEQLYADDFYAWTQLQAKELRRFARTRPNLPLDLAHLAEEIADLGTERAAERAAGSAASSSISSSWSIHRRKSPDAAGLRKS